MRRILHLVLCFSLVLLPLPVFGAGKYDAASSSSKKKKKKKKKKRVKKVKPAEEEQALEAERAQGEDDDEESQASRRKKKRRGKVVEVDAEGEGNEVTAEGDPAKTAKPEQPGKTDAPTKATAPAAVATAEEEEDDDDDVSFEDNPSKLFEALNKAVPPRRYAYVIGAVVGGVGLVFAYQAQGEAKRAETIVSALEAQRAVGNARASAALANVMYGLAGAALLLALVLEFIPEPIAEKAALVFRF